VDPTIFVRESFIFAGNSLARRADTFFFARNSFARRHQFSRASCGRVHPASPHRRLVQVVEIRSRQQSQVAPRHPGPKASATWGGVVSRETTTTWGVRARQGVQDSRDIKIAKLLCLCKNAKFGPSTSLPKCICQMQNCWRAIFKVFDKFQKCKIQLHNCWRCSNSF